MQLDKATASRRLTNRWHEQVRTYPTMRDGVPLALYVRVNLPSIMRSPLGLDALRAYDGEV